MKKNLLYVFTALVVIIAAFFLNANFARENANAVKFKSDVGGYPVYPREDKIYRVEDSPVTADKARALSHQYGMNKVSVDESKKQGDLRTYMANDGKGKNIMVDLNTGRFMFFDLTQAKQEGNKVPSKDEAIKIAQAKLKQVNKYGANLKFDAVGTMTQHGADLNGKPTMSEVMMYQVNFVRDLNGRSAGGPSSMSSIWVGDQGKVLGYDYDVNEIKTAKTVKIMSPQEALQKFNKALQAGKIDLYNPTEVTVKEMKYGYFTFLEKGKTARFIKPVYMMVGTVKYSGAESKNSPGAVAGIQTREDKLQYPFPAAKEAPVI